MLKTVCGDTTVDVLSWVVNSSEKNRLDTTRRFDQYALIVFNSFCLRCYKFGKINQHFIQIVYCRIVKRRLQFFWFRKCHKLVSRQRSIACGWYPGVCLETVKCMRHAQSTQLERIWSKINRLSNLPHCAVPAKICDKTWDEQSNHVLIKTDFKMIDQASLTRGQIAQQINSLSRFCWLPTKLSSKMCTLRLVVCFILLRKHILL